MNQEVEVKRVSIAGSAPSSRHLIPWKEEGEIWGCNTMWNAAERWDRWFEVHDFDLIQSDYKQHWDWLTSQPAGKPIYMQAVHPDIPASVAYPLNEVLEVFGSYFNNTISFMLAIAIMEKADWIGVYGVDMACAGIAGESEYAHQRPSCEHMLGWARGAGIKLDVPKQTELLKCRKLYGFGGHDHFEDKWNARKKELIVRINNEQEKLTQLEQQTLAQRDKVHTFAGAIDNMNWSRHWT